MSDPLRQPTSTQENGMNQLDKQPVLTRTFQIGDKIRCIIDTPVSLTNGDRLHGQYSVPLFSGFVTKGEIYCVRGISEVGGLHLVGIEGARIVPSGEEFSFHIDRFELVNRS